MRTLKGSRRITVGGVGYHWRARGDDGFIAILIWPSSNPDALIEANLRYHETWLPNARGGHSSAGDQIVVTNRIIRQVIEYAITRRGYDPKTSSADLNLKNADDFIQWQSAIRAKKSKSD